jgi:hypothetical protein
VLEDSDWELRWPPRLLGSEARWLLQPAVSRLPDWGDRVGHLLEEAFVGTEAREAFSRTSDSSRYLSGLSSYEVLRREAFLREVAEAAGRFRPEREPKSYWPTRHRGAAAATDLRQRFVQLVDDMRAMGYLDQELPWGCVDGGPDVDPSPVLELRLGVPDLWPLTESREVWDDDTFYGLIGEF